MKGFDIFYKLKEAYEVSTKNNNFFASLLDSIVWDEKYESDNELCFVQGDFTFMTPSLDPFKMPWSPSAVLEDRNVLEFFGGEIYE